MLDSDGKSEPFSFRAYQKKGHNAKRNRVFGSKEQRSVFPTVSVARFLNISLPFLDLFSE